MCFIKLVLEEKLDYVFQDSKTPSYDIQCKDQYVSVGIAYSAHFGESYRCINCTWFSRLMLYVNWIIIQTDPETCRYNSCLNYHLLNTQIFFLLISGHDKTSIIPSFICMYYELENIERN